jgi:hypothetical protein
VNLAPVLRSRWLLVVNQFRSGRRAGALRVRRPLIVIFLGAFAAALVSAALTVFFLSLADAGAGPREAAIALGVILTAGLAGLAAFDLHEAVSTLVADSDLELLRRAPVSGAWLFVIKLLDVVPRTTLLVMMLLLPALVAYTVCFPGPLWAWLLILPACAALWAVPMGLGTAAALGLLLVVPARIAREAFGMLSALTLLALWLGHSFLLPTLAEDIGDLMGALDQLSKSPAYRFSPAAFVGSMAGSASAGDPWGALRGLATALFAGLASLGLAAWVGGATLETVRARVLAGTGPRRAPRRARGLPTPGLGPALLLRDTRLFLRDWTVLGDVMTMSLMWTLLPLLGLPLWDMPRTLIARSMLLALTVALGFEVGSRAIPFERQGIAWMRMAPVRPWRWVFGRYLGTLAISLPIVAVAGIAVIFGFRLDAAEAASALGFAVPALLLGLALGLWAGAEFGNFSWNNPRAMLTVTGRLLSTVLLLVQAIGWLMFGFAIEMMPAAAFIMLAATVAAVLATAGLQVLAGRSLSRRLWN